MYTHTHKYIFIFVIFYILTSKFKKGKEKNLPHSSFNVVRVISALGRFAGAWSLHLQFYSPPNLEPWRTSALTFPLFRAGQTTEEPNLYSFQSGEGN